MSKVQYVKDVIDLNNMEIVHVLGGVTRLRREAVSWYESKLHSYPLDEFVLQMEKNLVYFAEATGSSVGVAASRLCTGKPNIPHQNLRAYVEQTGMQVPQGNVPAILGYLLGDVPNILVTPFSKVNWRKIREFKMQASVEEYALRIGKEAVIFHIATNLADNHLTGYLAHEKLASIGHSNDLPVILDYLYSRVKHTSTLIAELG